MGSLARFAGRVALVTGASSGIGAQIAEQLVRGGVVVVGVGRRQNRLDDLAARLSKEKGKLHPLVADVSREEEVRRMFQWVHDNLGGVSIVVNNAGVLALSPVSDLEATAIQRLVDTNLTSVMLSCREALHSMKKHGIKDGHIVNINSLAGHQTVNIEPFSMSAYSATKHGVTALSKGLRFDAQSMKGFNIRVSSISPGGVLTEMMPAEIRDSVKNPDDFLKAEDVADAVVYVLSCPPTVEITELTIQPTGEKM